MKHTVPTGNLYTKSNIKENLQEIRMSISTWPSWKVDSMRIGVDDISPLLFPEAKTHPKNGTSHLK